MPEVPQLVSDQDCTPGVMMEKGAKKITFWTGNGQYLLSGAKVEIQKLGAWREDKLKARKDSGHGEEMFLLP